MLEWENVAGMIGVESRVFKKALIFSNLIVTILLVVTLFLTNIDKRNHEMRDSNRVLMSIDGDVSESLLLMREPIYNGGTTDLNSQLTRTTVKTRLGAAYGSWMSDEFELESLGMNVNVTVSIGYILQSMAFTYTPPNPYGLKVPKVTFQATVQWYSELNSILSHSNGNYFQAINQNGNKLINLYKSYAHTPIIGQQFVLGID